MSDWDPEYLAAIEKEQCRLCAEAVAAYRAEPVRQSDIAMLREKVAEIQARERPLVDIERRDRAAEARWQQMASELTPPPVMGKYRSRGNDAYRAITEGRVTTLAALKQRLLRDPEVA